MNKKAVLNKQLLQFETKIWNHGHQNIAGVDEVGRGALAGPLVVAAVVLNKDHFVKNMPEEFEHYYGGIKDSKKVTPKNREILAKFILENSKSYSIQVIPHEIVDNVGITQATQMGFYNSIKTLKLSAGHILTDTFAINGMPSGNQTNIPKGDNKSLSIAAASIIAKVHRDNIMIELHRTYNEYGFDQHKGYGTKAHKEAINKFGPCEIHRTSFEPIKSLKANKTRIN